MYQMKKDLPEKLKPIVDSWKPGENTILYIELKNGGKTTTTLVLGSKNSIKATLYGLILEIAEHIDMSFADLVIDLVGFDIYNEVRGDDDETEENN